MGRPLSRSVSGALVALVVPWAAIAGQPDTLAAIRGTVASAFNGRPLSGVMISVPAARRFVVSDSTGGFALWGLPPGKQALRVSYLERGTTEHTIKLGRGQTMRLAVLLDVEAVDLAPVVVEGQGGAFERSLAGFYDRKRRALGTYYTWEDIDQLRPYRLSSLLRQSGVWVYCRGSDCVPYSLLRGRRCPMVIIVDGLPMDASFLDVIQPDEVAGVEIYRRGSQVPFEFVGWGSACGLVAVWSRT